MLRRKGDKLAVVILIVGLIIWGIILSYGPSTSKIPAGSVPSHSPRQAVTSPEPGSKVQVPAPKPDPVKTIYVVNENIGSRWGFLPVIKSWERAKHTRLEIIPVCPINVPCVIVREYAKIDRKVAGETLFTDGDYVYLNLNPRLMDVFEAQATMCHEFGHVLGMGHVKNSLNTCMTPKESYRILPTPFDLQTVDSFGAWESKKMYDLSGKTVDARPQPK